MIIGNKAIINISNIQKGHTKLVLRAIITICISILGSCSTIRSGLHSSVAVEQANRNLKEGNYPSAIRNFNIVINNLPPNSEKDWPDGTALLYYLRGYSYAKNGDCSKGLIDFQKANNLIEEAYKRSSYNDEALKKLSSDISSAIKLCNKQQ